jgi:5-dehydro-4-deoxyglucarate dehydratase
LSPARPVFAGVLFFPVTPFTESGAVDLDALARHIANGLDAGPGGVFIACGTGEFHALDPQEFEPVVRTAVEVVAGRVPVYAGAGGSIAQAKQFAKAGRTARAVPALRYPRPRRHRLRKVHRSELRGGQPALVAIGANASSA